MISLNVSNIRFNVFSALSAKAFNAWAISEHGSGASTSASATASLRTTYMSAACPDHTVSSRLLEISNNAVCTSGSVSASDCHFPAVSRSSSQSPKNGFLTHSSIGLTPNNALQMKSTPEMAMRSVVILLSSVFAKSCAL